MNSRKVLLVLFLALFYASQASAQQSSAVLREIKAKNQQAMESYDLLEYEEAQKLLKDSLALARKQGVKDPVVARTYLNLAIVLHSGFSNVADARLAMIEAVRIDDTIEIEPAYRTKALSTLLAEAKREFGQSAKRANCGEIKGLEHVRIERAPANTPRQVEVQVGKELDAKEVYVYFRPAKNKEYFRAALERSSDCTFAGSIPQKAMQGDAIHYFIQAINQRGVVVANRGSQDSAYIIELDASSGTANEGENPFEVSGKATVRGDAGDRFYFAFAGGSGGGIVTGKTEQTGTDVSCCLGAALLHVVPEFGYRLRDNLGIGAVLRWGIPLGANLADHANSAVSGLVRARYGFSGGLDGLQVVGSVGVGILRHTVNLTMADRAGSVDTVASGPFIIGPGLAYWFPVSSGILKIVLETHTLVAFSAGVQSYFGHQTGFGVQFDFNAGVVLSF